jgi:hypothetical protein
MSYSVVAELTMAMEVDGSSPRAAGLQARETNAGTVSVLARDSGLDAVMLSM